jgi:hypothetical protein
MSMEIDVRSPDMAVNEVVGGATATEITWGLTASRILPDMRSVAQREADDRMCRHHVTIRRNAEARLMRSKKHSKSPTTGSRNNTHII